MQSADSNCSDLRKKEDNFFNSMLPEFIWVATRYLEQLDNVFSLKYQIFPPFIKDIIPSDITSPEERRII